MLDVRGDAWEDEVMELPSVDNRLHAGLTWLGRRDIPLSNTVPQQLGRINYWTVFNINYYANDSADDDDCPPGTTNSTLPVNTEND